MHLSLFQRKHFVEVFPVEVFFPASMEKGKLLFYTVLGMHSLALSSVNYNLTLADKIACQIVLKDWCCTSAAIYRPSIRLTSNCNTTEEDGEEGKQDFLFLIVLNYTIT